ncbi:hypothetical protein SDC9_88401 [bioreactor metagenome]|uniref:Uncharacterized protein n=1 Tax=bioreactor metagenome TaxID=1076179 RepID=A0A644ZLH5_9ZZZZ
MGVIFHKMPKRSLFTLFVTGFFGLVVCGQRLNRNLSTPHSLFDGKSCLLVSKFVCVGVTTLYYIFYSGNKCVHFAIHQQRQSLRYGYVDQEGIL